MIAVKKAHEASYFFVVYSDVSAGLISHMHVMLLLDESADSASHRDDIIIGMRRKDDDAFGVWHGTLWAGGVVGVWLTAGPSRNGVL